MPKAKSLQGTDKDKQLFIFKAGGGVTCWGFQNAVDDTIQLQKALGEPEIEFDLGDVAVLKEYDRLIDWLVRSGTDIGTFFKRRTPKEVAAVLERARKKSLMIRLWLGDRETGRCWMEEHDVFGRVARSQGPLKIPIMIERGRGISGGAISDDCVIKVDEWAFGFEAGGEWSRKKTLYQHPKFNMPDMRIVENADEHRKTHPFRVLFDGELQARFETQGKAARYVAFHHGEVSIP